MRPLLLATVLAALTCAGCLRQRFDLCAQTPPHPECLIDAGASDASVDASIDASADAFAAPDAVTNSDAPDAR